MKCIISLGFCISALFPAMAQNIGIGTNTPTARLHISSATSNPLIINGGTNMFFTLSENAINRGYIGSFSGNAEDVDFGTYSGNNTGKVHLTTGGNIPRLTVGATGNVGIGTQNPSEKLDINGALRIGNTSNTLPGTIRFNTANNDFEGYDGTRWRSLTSNTNGSPLQSDTSESTAASEFMGQAVKFLEPYIFVGVPGDDIGANADQGSVKIFKKNAFTGDYELFQTITATGGAAGDAFGSSLDAISFTKRDTDCPISVGLNTTTDYIAISAPKKDYPAKTDQGAVYLFAFDIAQNQFLQKGGAFTAADGAAGDGFGLAICFREKGVIPSIFVSAPYKTINGNIWQGKCYLFGISGNECILPYLYHDEFYPLASFVLPNGVGGDLFGGSIAETSEYNQSGRGALAIGCTRRTINGQQNQGAVYLYRESSGGDQDLLFDKEILATDGNANDFFGTSIAFDKRNNPSYGLVVGSPGKENGAISRQGAVYTFGIDFNMGSNLEQVSKINLPTGITNDDFGTVLEYSPNGILMISCPGDDEGGTDAGAVFAFEPNADPRKPVFYQKAKIMGISPQANSKVATAISIDRLAKKYVLGIPNWDLPGKADAGKIIIGDIFN